MAKTSSVHLSTSEKLELISSISTMLLAGIPILETIDSLLEDSKGNQRKFLTSVREDLMEGQHISTAFSKFPKIFDKITVSLIKASEEGGTLDETLKDLKATIQKEAEFRDKLRAAFTYPVLIFLVFIGVMLMMLVVVIPKISTVFIQLKVQLPLPTQILIFISNLLLNYTIFFVGGTVGIIMLLVFIYRSQQKLLLNFLFSLPVISRLVKEIDLARFSRSMYLLLSSGVPITGALELAQDVVLTKNLIHALQRCQELVLGGKKLSEGMKEAKNIIPSIMIKIIEAGEKSGSLDRSMQDITEYLDYQVNNTMQTTTSLLEPLILIFVGVLIGGLMLAIIAPIYGLIGQIGTH